MSLYRKNKMLNFSLILIFFVIPILLFQNCSNSSSGKDSLNPSGLTAQSDFNNKLMLLMVNAAVPAHSTTGAYITINTPLVACTIDKTINKDVCYFIFDANEAYKSSLPEAAEVKRFLYTQQAPLYNVDSSNSFIYIRNISCIGNMISLDKTSCSYEKTICQNIEDCILGYSDELPEPFEPVVIEPTYTPNNPPQNSNGEYLDFIPTSTDIMTELSNEPLINPTDFKIKISLKSTNNSKYGGEVLLAFKNNGVINNIKFEAGLGTNPSYKGMYDNGRLQSDFNYWYLDNDLPVFTGFFEETYGAIVLVVKQNSANPVSYSGEIYYKKFTLTAAPKSSYRACWFTYMGPYDCRSTNIINKTNQLPNQDQGYFKLGTFENLNINNSFMNN